MVVYCANLLGEHVCQVFFRNEHSDAFIPVYPENETTSAKVKIWAIHYPPDIKENSKYLAKSPEKKEKKK